MRNIILILTTIVLLFGCHPYCVDVLQGNMIDNKMASKLHLGMTKDKVSSTLGTPVLKDTFDPNTWIYTYTQQINCGKIVKRKMLLKFRDNKLIQIN